MCARCSKYLKGFSYYYYALLHFGQMEKPSSRVRHLPGAQPVCGGNGGLDPGGRAPKCVLSSTLYCFRGGEGRGVTVGLSRAVCRQELDTFELWTALLV